MHVAAIPVPGHLPTVTRGFSHAWRVGDLVFVSGQVGIDDQGRVVGQGDMRAQAVQVFENLKTVLVAAGAGLDRIIKLTIFCTDAARAAEVREVRSQYLGDHWPASTLVIVQALGAPEWLVEIEAVAAVAPIRHA